VKLTPLPLTKLAHASLGVAAMPFGIGLWVDGFAPEPVARTLAAVLLGVGSVIAVRGLRIGVECRDGTVRVRGLLRTRVVPKASIEEVTSLPALRWRDSAGRRQWTPIVFLGDSPGAFSHSRRHNAAELNRLRKWITRPRP
jgi:hypothetical protein